MNSNNDILYSDLIKILGEDNVKKSEPMKNHTTFRIGGDADLFVTPVNAAQIHDTVIYLKKAEVPYYVVGNGSNLLVSDAGYRGVIIQLYSRFAGYEIFHEQQVCWKITRIDFPKGLLNDKEHLQILLTDAFKAYNISGWPGEESGQAKVIYGYE